MKIFVQGLSKSGTSALTYRIYNSLPADTTDLLFESRKYKPAPLSQHVIAKRTLDRLLIAEYGHNSGPLGNRDYAGYQQFDKQVLIVRDPRDRLVSSVLFQAFGPDEAKDEQFVLSFVNFLKLKEVCPGSIRFYDLARFMRAYGRFAGRFTPQLPRWDMDLSQWERPLEQWLIEYERARGNLFVVYYEDFVENKLEALEDYLGLRLSGPSDLPPEYEHIGRTKAAGDHSNWFTKEDTVYFNNFFSFFFERHPRYREVPEVSANYIPSENASEYVLRIVNRRRQMLLLAPLNFDDEP